MQVRPRWKQPTWESQISGPTLFQDAPERVLRVSANGLIPPASPPRRTGERALNRASIPYFAAPESTTGISHCSSEPTLAKEWELSSERNSSISSTIPTSPCREQVSTVPPLETDSAKSHPPFKAAWLLQSA